MNEVTQILSQIEQGDAQKAGELLPLVYEELRRIAALRLAEEQPGQTLQAAALVHEAYLRLVGQEDRQAWQGRRHFFAAAAEAMRRILVENARRKGRIKRGGDLSRAEFDESQAVQPEVREDLVALDEALSRLAATDRIASQLVELRYFAGLTVAEAAEALGISARTADRIWVYARAWLHREVQGPEGNSSDGENFVA